MIGWFAKYDETKGKNNDQKRSCTIYYDYDSSSSIILLMSGGGKINEDHLTLYEKLDDDTQGDCLIITPDSGVVEFKIRYAWDGDQFVSLTIHQVERIYKYLGEYLK